MENKGIGNDLIRTDFMSIEKVSESENYANSDRFIKLDSASANGVSAAIQAIPSAVVGNALSGAYRVEFPKGLSGVLVPHNGGSLAIIRDPVTKHFVGQGTLYSLSDVGMMYSVFSGLSIATGQYFMRKINDNLLDIRAKLDQVLDFLYTDKSCELYAQAQMVFGIYHNCTSIMKCSEQRIASLQTIQRAKILAERNIQFYYRDMNKLASKKDSWDSLINDLNNYTQAVSLYGVCAVVEIVLSENYDDDFLRYIEADLKRHVEKHHEEVGQLKGMLLNQPTAAAVPFMPAQKNDARKQNLLKLIDDLLGKDSPVKGYGEVIAQMCNNYNNKSEYRIVPDGSVYLCR